MQPTHRITSAGTVLAIFAFLLVFPIAAMQSSKADKVSNEKVERVGNGVKPPVPIQKQAPIYTQQAKDDKIQGKVKLDVIIGEDGAVKEVTVIQALDPGLDENAVSAVKNWRFEPATKDGKPVAVKSTIEINFTLK